MESIDKNNIIDLIKRYSSNVLLEHINNTKFINEPPIDSAIIDENDYDNNGNVVKWPKIYTNTKDIDGIAYFGNCVNTVPRVWQTYQMLDVIRNSELICLNDIDNIYNKLFGGEKALPKYIQKYIQKYCVNGVQDLNELVSGINEYQEIFWIYITKLDKHFFFDVYKKK